MKVLFIPCWHDGLPMDSGSAKVRAEWVCRYWDEAEVYDKTQSFAGHDLYVFQKAYLIEETRNLIRLAAKWRDQGKCRLAFDLCDPDFLSEEHRRRMLMVLALFDFAVCTTPKIGSWLAQYLPTYEIPDRVDVEEMESIGEDPKKRERFQTTHKPVVGWAGYKRNASALVMLASVVKELDLPLQVKALDRPKTFREFWQMVLGFDILLNPRPDRSPFNYKSDNKTLIAWSLGLPVARTAEELRKLCDPQIRVEESLKRWQEVRHRWDVRFSVEEWRSIAEAWR